MGFTKDEVIVLIMIIFASVACSISGFHFGGIKVCQEAAAKQVKLDSCWGGK